MSNETRIYIVTDRLNQSTRLVRAANPAQALRHVAIDQFEVTPAKADHIAGFLGSDLRVEVARAAEAA